MAKETKAQRDARFDAETAARLLAMAEAYPQRLMTLLERATKMNFELSVMDAQFRVEDRDNRRAGMYLLPYEFTAYADSQLDDLEWDVKEKEGARAEAERKANLRQTALSKLTAEEREALSL